MATRAELESRLIEVQSNIRIHEASLQELESTQAKLASLRTQEANLKAGIGRTLEIADGEAPNAGKRWSDWEKEMVEDRLAQFVYDLAVKTGRSTSAIRYRIVGKLFPLCPDQTIAY